MKQYQGIPYTTLPDPKDPEFGYRLKNLLSILDRWSRDVSDGFGQIKAGYVPDGSGTPLVNSAVSKDTSFSAGETNLVQGYTDTDSIQEWYNAAGTRMAYFSKYGALTVPYLTIDDPLLGLGPLTVLDGYGGLTVGSANITLLNVLGNTDLQGQVLLSSLDPGTVLTVIGSSSLQGTTDIATLSLVGGTSIIDGNGLNDSMPLYSTGTTNSSTLDVSGIGSSQIYSLPSAGGTLLTPNAAASLGTGYKYLMNTSAGGFSDSNSSTKTIRFDISGLATSTTRSIRWNDIAGSVVVVGNTTSASGTLGASSLTGQTGSVGSTTLLTGTTATAGMYRLSFYMKTTTAGTAGTVKATAAWNDGSAQTMDIPLMTTGGAATTVALNTLNAFGQGSVVVYAAASQNITYTTTVTGATGSPQYYIYVRIEKL